MTEYYPTHAVNMKSLKDTFDHLVQNEIHRWFIILRPNTEVKCYCVDEAGKADVMCRACFGTGHTYDFHTTKGYSRPANRTDDFHRLPMEEATGPLPLSYEVVYLPADTLNLLATVTSIVGMVKMDSVGDIVVSTTSPYAIEVLAYYGVSYIRPYRANPSSEPEYIALVVNTETEALK